MPTLPGSITPSSIYQDPPSWQRSPEISELAQATYPFDARDTTSASAGTLTNTQPIDIQQFNLAGDMLPAFKFDWYYRIHFFPPVINLGIIETPVERDLMVWNAYFDLRTLLAINEIGTDGIMISGQQMPPTVFGPLISRNYLLEVDIEGPPVIDAEYRFSFTGDFTYTLKVTGRRILLIVTCRKFLPDVSCRRFIINTAGRNAAIFGAQPDWTHGITERLEWLTEVIEAYDGTEQRVRLRKAPRRGFEYQFVIDDCDTSFIDNLLHAWSSRIYVLPIWTDVSTIDTGVGKGSRTLPVQDMSNSDYLGSGMVVLWRSAMSCEVAEIMSITGNLLTFKQPLLCNWPAGTRVFPARLARLDGEVIITRLTDTIATGRCRFVLLDMDEPIATDYGQEYQGYRVMDWPPDWSDDIDVALNRKLAVLDYATGVSTYDDESGKPIVTRSYTWLLHDRSAITTFRRWLSARAGRTVPFWMPSWQSDLKITRAILPTDTYIVVINVGYSRLLTEDPLRRDIRIVTTEGSVYYRRITGAIMLDEYEEVLFIDSPLGVAIPPRKVLQVSYMSLSRLDQDAVELHWETDRIARIRLSIRSIVQ